MGGCMLIVKRGGGITLSSREKVQPNPSVKSFVVCKFQEAVECLLLRFLGCFTP